MRTVWVATAVLFALLPVLCAGASGRERDGQAFGVIQPDVLDEFRVAGGESVSLLIKNLLPSTSYEVRVSFPGTARVSRFLVEFPEASLATSDTANRRRLLDVDKINFSTDSEGRIVGVEGRPIVRITAHQPLAPQLPSQAISAKDDLAFNVIVQSLHAGAPMDALVLFSIFCFVLLPIILFVFLPFAREEVQLPFKIVGHADSKHHKGH